MFFQYAGKLFHNGKYTAGNQEIKDNDSVALEVNLNSTPRTVHLFINNVQQPIFISGVPESVQFFFFIYQIGNSVTVLSLKRLTATSVQNIPGSKQIKWEWS
ncbi:MAG: hypothetical protein EZS28_041991 [Streblomastix strix]|uniref:Galectin n=1 Tax=Streblomastix strix TaxID=222440 RepID=A0A5J4TX39_9EUKA|nr:MAG: hypothetical protein EZS28_041991 [Streblomastix strix]